MFNNKYHLINMIAQYVTDFTKTATFSHSLAVKHCFKNWKLLNFKNEQYNLHYCLKFRVQLGFFVSVFEISILCSLKLAAH